MFIAPSVRSQLKSVLPVAALSAAIIFVAAMWLPQHAHAAETALQNLDTVQQASGLGSSSLGSIIGKIIRIFLGTLGAVALCLVIYGGFVWMTAGGGEEKIEKAKMILRNAGIGLALILMSYAITTFILGKLGYATGFTPNAPLTKNSGAGSLSGFEGGSPLGTVIEGTDPSRGASNVPRNKSVTVQFKMPIDPASVIDLKSSKTKRAKFKDENGKESEIAISGPLKDGAFKLFATADGDKTALKSDEVIVFMGGAGSDLTSVVFNPVPFLGSASKATDYTAVLGPSITRYGTGISVFSGFSAGYTWKFNVSTELDLTPPRVVSIIPTAAGTFDRNITIQITFSEPVNLASAVGKFGDSFSFDNITARDAAKNIVPGEWRAGSDFNIVEFTPREQCATNTCGQKIFCLPSNQIIYVRARSGKLIKLGDPQVDPSSGYSGVADTADNALDGGGENAKTQWSQSRTPAVGAQGSDADDFFMNFKTTDQTKVSAPRIVEVQPAPKTSSKTNSDFTSSSTVNMKFDSLMKVTTFGSVKMNAQVPKAQAGYSKLAENISEKVGNVDVERTRLTLDHVPFARSQAYATIIPSTVQDIYQNCFLPAGGVNTAQGINCGFKEGDIPVNRFCCNGIISDKSCTLLEYGSNAK